MPRNLPGKITREAPPGPEMTEAQMKIAMERQTQDAELWRELRELLGYVENGSDTRVTISQDDATRWWVVTTDYGSFHAESLPAALRLASRAR